MQINRSSNRRDAIDILAAQILKKDYRPLSAGSARYRQEKLPHSLHALGNGYALPLTIWRSPVGYHGISVDVPGFAPDQVRHLWIAEDQVERPYLIAGSYMFGLPEELISGGVEARRIYAMRAYLALRGLGFPCPTMPSGTSRRIERRLEDEALRVGGDD